MRLTGRTFAAVSAAVLLTLAVAVAEEPPTTGRGPRVDGITNGPQAPEALARVCGRCHDADSIVDGRRSRGQWQEVLEQMIGRGASGTEEDFRVIIEHLVSEHGRVTINKAPADELAQVLHLAARDADAIVTYRKSHGPFADFDALIAMPDAPVEALRKRRDAIVF